VAASRKPTSHALHLLLTLLTGGLWLFVWIMAALVPSGWRCMKCGGRTRFCFL
jgi:hypothetical protein